MKKPSRSNPRGYDGTGLTTHQLSDLLPVVLEQMGEVYSQRPDLILATWPQVIGPKLASMTKAISFYEGVLLVKVNNSTLYSLLIQHEKQRLLQVLKEKFPRIEIKNIMFQIG